MFKHCINIMEILKTAMSWGNSAGVLLPREWKNKEVKVILIDRTLQIRKEIFDILDTYLEDIIGIYLVGSYGRQEQIERSDVDLLVITNKTDKRIERSKYIIILISQEEVEKALDRNIFPLLPMLKEAKSILNASLIEHYKKTPLTKKNTKFHIETTKSAMRVNKEAIKLDESLELKNTSDASAYSLILRLRSIYILDCLIKNKTYRNSDFLRLVENISGSLKAYEGYLRSKDDKKAQEKLPIIEAKRLYEYITKKIKEQEKWVRKRR